MPLPTAGVAWLESMLARYQSYSAIRPNGTQSGGFYQSVSPEHAYWCCDGTVDISTHGSFLLTVIAAVVARLMPGGISVSSCRISRDSDPAVFSAFVVFADGYSVSCRVICRTRLEFRWDGPRPVPSYAQDDLEFLAHAIVSEVRTACQANTPKRGLYSDGND